MSYSYVEYDADGTTGPFTITFPYISSNHVSVEVDGVSVGFSWINTSSIQLDNAVLSPSVIKLKRTTPVNAALVDFHDTSNLKEKDLDTNALQMLYVVQEGLDNNTDSEEYVDTAVAYLQAWVTNAIDGKAPLDHTHDSYGSLIVSRGTELDRLPAGDTIHIRTDSPDTIELISNGEVSTTLATAEDITTLEAANIALSSEIESIEKYHILRFSAMGTLVPATRFLDVISGVSGTIVEVCASVQGTAAATIKIEKSDINIYENSVGESSVNGPTYAETVSVACSSTNLFYISVVSIDSGTPVDLTGYVKIKEG
jgi:hypothetical protein